MGRSWNLGRIAGIAVRMHWSFLLLLAWVLAISLYQGAGWAAAGESVIFVAVVFFCVVLHELGHALVARRYGVQTRDILLLPIGGVSRLERIPEDPRQELRVALAGPAVSVILAAFFYALGLMLQRLANPLLAATLPFFANLVWVNALLALFNLLPAFPMDGGRVLRALLARRMSYPKATKTAASIGQGVAVLVGFLGLFYNPFLLLIALFVYFGAKQEALGVEMRTAFKDLAVREAMVTRFRTLQARDTLAYAARELISGLQQDFPVTEGEHYIGLLRRGDLLKALAEKSSQLRVGELADAASRTVADDTTLAEVLNLLREEGLQTIPVTRDAVVVGLLTADNVAELLMVQAALSEHWHEYHNGEPEPPFRPEELFRAG